jgi:hypothetical protein
MRNKAAQPAAEHYALAIRFKYLLLAISDIATAFLAFSYLRKHAL